MLSRGAAVTLLGGRGDDRLYAARNYRHSPRELNRVSLVGNGGADVLIGNSAANELFADRYAPTGQSRDPDRLYGRGGHDRLYGNAGPNLLDGGPGQDLVWAGRGDDVLRLRSHDLDGGSCGGGFDRIDVDVRDSLAQRAGCEHITRSSPAVETFDAFNGAAAGRKLIADERRFYVDLTWPPDAARRCRGQVLMRYRSRVLARGSFSTRRGREDQIALHLTAAGRHKFIDQGAYIETVLEIRSRDRWGRPRATRAGGWISSLSLEV